MSQKKWRLMVQQLTRKMNHSRRGNCERKLQRRQKKLVGLNSSMKMKISRGLRALSVLLPVVCMYLIWPLMRTSRTAKKKKNLVWKRQQVNQLRSQEGEGRGADLVLALAAMRLVKDPPAQQDEQEVSSLPFNGAIFLSYQRSPQDQSIKENTAGCVSEDKVISDSCAAQRRGNISNAAVPARQNVIIISSDGDEPALRSEKVDPDEVTSRRICRRIDSRDVNMGRSNCARNEMTQAGHARVRTSGVARARGMHSLMRNLSLMPSRPRFEEELIKNVNGEAKNAQRKRFRLLSEFYGV